jgi:hypothetical protein
MREPVRTARTIEQFTSVSERTTPCAKEGRLTTMERPKRVPSLAFLSNS